MTTEPDYKDITKQTEDLDEVIGNETPQDIEE